MTLNAWTFVLSTEFVSKKNRAVYFTDLIGLSRINPVLAITFVCTLFSMAGVPPLAGFCAKMYVFFAAMESSQYLIAILGVLFSVIGAFYYLRLIKIMYFEKMKTWLNFKNVSREQSIILGGTSLFIVFFFINPTPLFILTHHMALNLAL